MCTRVYVCARASVRVCVRVRVHVCVRTCVCAFVQVCVHVCACMRMYVSIYVCVCAYPRKTQRDKRNPVSLTSFSAVFPTDAHIANRLVQDKLALYNHGNGPLRRKRTATLIGRADFAVGRTLFGGFSRGGTTRSGSRITRHYDRPGSYQDAVQDFNRLRPDNVKAFKGGINGRTGTMGKYRVTVRDGSSGNSRPTLEIRSHGGDMVRKFRYNP